MLLVAAPINRDEGNLGGLKELFGDPLDLQAVHLVFGIPREAGDVLVEELIVSVFQGLRVGLKPLLVLLLRRNEATLVLAVHLG